MILFSYDLGAMQTHSWRRGTILGLPQDSSLLLLWSSPLLIFFPLPPSRSTLIWLTGSQHVSRTVQTSIAFNLTSERRGVHVQVHTSCGDEPVYTACLSPLCPPSVKPFTSTAFDRRRPTQTLPSSFHLCWVFIAKKSNNVIKVNPAIYKVFWNLLWMDWTHYE